jgi:hypothetical protein
LKFLGRYDGRAPLARVQQINIKDPYASNLTPDFVSEISLLRRFVYTAAFLGVTGFLICQRYGVSFYHWEKANKVR